MTIRKFLILLLAGLITAATIFFIVRHRKLQKHLHSMKAKEIWPSDTGRLWFKKAIIYTLDVEVFKDADGDGCGDFKGLTQKLGYIDSLGVDVIWLAPFQPSANEDDGYDITDFYGIDARLGTKADFDLFMKEAKKHHKRVIMDIVVNHTSDKHPWFQEARRGITAPHHNWYVWSGERPANYDKGMVFPGVQKDIWTYDTVAGLYYYHRFYNFQPDLNVQLPEVYNEILHIMKYWLDQGVSGFRLDAVPFFIEIPQKHGEKFKHQFQMLEDIQQHMRQWNSEAVILGEANVTPGETKDFFGKNGERMNMMFNFYVNQHLFYALATEDVRELRKAMEATHNIPRNVQWAQFLRNHDEVDLGRLSRKERNRVYEAFGPDSNMQLYDRGIRRRLAPMLHNNRKQLELAYSFLFALPSTPVMRYGDEISMGDNLMLKERLSVRTPMQWSIGRNRGFSSADTPVRPMVIDVPYRDANVTDEQGNQQSMLHWTQRMIQVRKQQAAISYGTWTIQPSNESSVIVLTYKWQQQTLITLHNFSKKRVAVNLKEIPGARLQNIITRQTLPVSGNNYKVQAEGYGYYWYRVMP